MSEQKVLHWVTKIIKDTEKVSKGIFITSWVEKVIWFHILKSATYFTDCYFLTFIPETTFYTIILCQTFLANQNLPHLFIPLPLWKRWCFELVLFKLTSTCNIPIQEDSKNKNSESTIEIQHVSLFIVFTLQLP